MVRTSSEAVLRSTLTQDLAAASGLIILLRSFKNATPDLEDMFAYSLHPVRDKALRLASERSLHGLDSFARGTPFALSFLYLAHDFLVNDGVEEAEVGIRDSLEANYHSVAANTIRNYVQNLTSRWNLASVHVKIWEVKRIVHLAATAP